MTARAPATDVADRGGPERASGSSGGRLSHHSLATKAPGVDPGASKARMLVVCDVGADWQMNVYGRRAL